MKYLSSLLLGLFLVTGLAACDVANKVVTASNSPVGVQAVNDARNTVFAIKAGYGALLPFATAYVKQTPCTAPNAPKPPACSSTAVVVQLSKAQIATSATINNAEEAVLNATSNSSTLTASVDAAKAAYASFQAVMKTYNLGEAK